MATLPSTISRLTLLRGVPFSNDYQHTRYFETREEQLAYFSSKPVLYSTLESNIIQAEGKTSIKVDMRIDDIRRANYLMFQNKDYSVRWFYAFITKLEYVNERVTIVHFELDVYQTWCKDYEIKPSYVVREHCKLWNSDGTPVINTQDEFLDYGKEYDVISAYKHKLNNGLKWLVIVSKSLLHGAEDNKYISSTIGIPQPLTYYVIPFEIGSNRSPNIKFEPNSTDYPVTPIDQVLTSLYDNERAVNNVVSLYISDDIGINATIERTSGFPSSVTIPRGTGANVETIPKSSGSIDLQILHISKASQFDIRQEVLLADKFSGLNTSKETKLMMYPYSLTTIDDFRGNRMDIKNEYVKGTPLSLLVRGSLGTANKVAYGVKGYNQTSNIEYAQDMYLYMENALIDNNSNELPILTEHLASYLQGNRNSIQNQKDGAILNGITSMARSGVQTGMGLTPRGSTLGAIDGIQSAGDMIVQLQGIQAKQDDIANIPPQMNKMGSNVTFDYGNQYDGLWVIKKQIKPEYRKKLEDFFNMFGYKLNEVKIPNIKTRQNWNFVQTKGVNIIGEFNANDLNEIKALYNNGITFWHTDDIGNYNLTNEVR